MPRFCFGRAMTIVGRATVVAAATAVAAVALASDPPAACSLLCVPHECLGMVIEREVQRGLLADVRRELDALPRSVIEVGVDERGAGGGDPPVPSYNGFRNESTALLITVGGPPRAESIVQAHVLIKVSHHGLGWVGLGCVGLGWVSHHVSNVIWTSAQGHPAVCRGPCYHPRVPCQSLSASKVTARVRRGLAVTLAFTPTPTLTLNPHSHRRPHSHPPHPVKLVREHHGESAAQLPIEVWHAGEPGMPQACDVWSRLFGVVCHDTWQTAIEGGHLAQIMGLPFNGNNDDIDDGDEGSGGDGDREKGQGGATTQPPLEWVRGWPIKPLVLLLTKWDTVVMVDADSIPLRPVHELAASLLANLASGGGGDDGGDDGGGGVCGADGGGGGGGVCDGDSGAVFWPDITPLVAGHATMRKALGLPPTGDGEGGAEPLSAESGQMVVDRYRSWDALRIAWVLNAHPVVYTLLHGDKDTYRLAWEFAGLPYYQISQPPLALGGLGPQEMVDGSTAMASSGPSGFCGQALLQRNAEGDALFVHRVLSKYNIMNLLTADSWGWTAPLVAPLAARQADAEETANTESEERRSGAGLVQRGWCIETEGSTGSAAAARVPQEVHWKSAAPSVSALAKKAVEARMDMVDHF